MAVGSLFINVYSFPFHETALLIIPVFYLLPDGVVRQDYPLFIFSRISMVPKGVAFVLRVTILPF